MTQALLLSVFIALSAQSSKKPGSARLAAAQADFNRGDFQSALRDLEVASAEATDDDVLSRVHLLRGQCFGAQRDLVKAEQAFEKALEADPEAKLDPTRVDPSLVTLLEGLRDRMTGELEVRTNRPARVMYDGKPLGTAPLKASVAIGRRRLEAKSQDGRYSAAAQVVVAARKRTEVQLDLTESPRTGGEADSMVSAPPREGPASSLSLFGGRPLADLRVVVNGFNFFSAPGIEVGFGLEWPYLRGSAHFRFFPNFGITPRGGLWVPIVPQLRGYAELELPILFPAGTNPGGIGLGGAGGAEYFPNQWLSVFGEVGARYFFTGLSTELPVQLGFRLRLP
jgi:hypothetical protein